MALSISDAAQDAAVTAIADLVDAASPTAGLLRIYNGTRPANPDVAVTTQTLLAEFELADPAFGTPTAGEVTLLGVPIDTTGADNGTASWGRLLDGNEDAVADGTVGTSGTDIIVNTTAFTTGVDVTLTAGVLRMPQAA